MTTTLETLQSQFGTKVLETGENRMGQPVAIISRDSLIEIMTFLRDDANQDYKLLCDLTAVDGYQVSPRFTVVYQLRSLTHHAIVTLKVKVDANESIPSVSGIYPTANWLEREVYDLMGITFEGHPDLRRIVTPDHWEGHPLRKDYPLRGMNEPLFVPTADDV